MDFTVSSAEIGLVGQETEVSAKARRRQFGEVCRSQLELARDLVAHLADIVLLAIS